MITAIPMNDDSIASQLAKADGQSSRLYGQTSHTGTACHHQRTGNTIIKE